jgi:hypothetical protein
MLAHDIALALDPCLLMQEAGLEPIPGRRASCAPAAIASYSFAHGRPARAR